MTGRVAPFGQREPAPAPGSGRLDRTSVGGHKRTKPTRGGVPTPARRERSEGGAKSQKAGFSFNQDDTAETAWEDLEGQPGDG
jgi:hypothetical protein